MAVGRANTIRTGIATTNHDHIFAIGAQLPLQLVAGIDFVLLRQKLHRKVNTVQITAGHRQVA